MSTTGSAVLAVAVSVGSLAWVAVAGVGCGSSGGSAGEPRYTVVRNDQPSQPSQGIAPDKEAEIRLVLQQRDVSTRKCYQDVLNEKHDRAFQGTVKMLIGVGTSRAATSVKVVGGTLNDQEVQSCLVSTIETFEFPELTQPGEVQYEFQFRPAY